MSPDERINDELLVLSVQEGDPAAFERLVERWQERLWRHAWRLTGDEEAAWDVLQETWIGIVRGVRRLEDAALFPAWAYRIASNKSRDWIRRRARRRRAREAYGAEKARTGNQDSRRLEEAADLKDALADLSGSDRAILSLRYEECFDTAEIAEILKIPEGTVKSRLHYTRKRLHRLLTE